MQFCVNQSNSISMRFRLTPHSSTETNKTNTNTRPPPKQSNKTPKTDTSKQNQI